MAYADRHERSLTSAGLVVLLHAGAIYALVTGLSFVGVIKHDENLTSITPWKEPPPPPPPDPTVKPEPTSAKPLITAVPPPEGLDFTKGPVIVAVNDPHIGEDFTFPTGGQTATPTPTPSFTPRFARPRGDQSRWVTPNDYPSSELRAEHQGTTRVQLAIDEQGRVSNCSVVKSSGYPLLDLTACSKVAQRARFDPATGTDGQPVAGTFTTGIRWTIPE